VLQGKKRRGGGGVGGGGGGGGVGGRNILIPKGFKDSGGSSRKRDRVSKVSLTSKGALSVRSYALLIGVI